MNALFSGFEPIAHPRLGDDIPLRRGVWLQLLAQLAHEHAEILHLLGALTAPDCAEQSAVVDDFAGTARQENQQIEFFRSEPHFAASDRNFVSRGIDAKIAN